MGDNGEKIRRVREVGEKVEGRGMIYCRRRKWGEEVGGEVKEKRGKGRDYYEGVMDRGDRILI